VATSFSYPEGNFGGNQLLDCSISLSPLYSHLTIDLHVRIATSLHQTFVWLHPTQAKFAIFRVPTVVLSLKSIQDIFLDRSMVQSAFSLPQDFPPYKGYFHYASLVFSTKALAQMLDSLVRVTRRVG